MSQSARQLIIQLARKHGVDPQVALRVASAEGGARYGAVGDGGHAFGPFQMNDAGGVLTGRAGDHAAYANSPAGIEAAIIGIAKYAAGLHGQAGVAAAVRGYERPANPGAEIIRAMGGTGGIAPSLGGAQGGNGAALGGSLSSGGTGTNLRQQVAAMLLGAAQNGGQFSPGGLMALAQARHQAGAAQDVFGGRTAGGSVMTGKLSGTAGGFLAAGAAYKGGRADQGRDFQTSPGQGIVAPGDGQVVAVKSDPGGFGPSYPVVHFTSGKYAGKTIYIGHTLSVLRPGQKFSAGQTISRTGIKPVGNAGVPGWAEIGYAAGGNPGSFGQSTPF